MGKPNSHIIVVGAGLAGMTAAVLLSEAGHTVEVLEARPFIGGRTSSWNDNGMEIESGLHRFLGFYTELPGILQKVGINLDDMLFWEDEIEIRTTEGASAVFGLAPLHKPLETLEGAFGNNDFLTPADKLSVVKMFTVAAKDYLTKPEHLDKISVLNYAKELAVTEQAINRLLIPLSEGIFFVPIHKYSMYNFVGLFMPHLKAFPKLRVGAFAGGMSDVMMAPVAAYVQKHGGVVRPSMPVDRLVVKNKKVCGVMVNGKEIMADHVIVAASLHGAQQILAKDFKKHASLQNLFKLQTMPAVTFQLELKKPSMKVDRTTFGPHTAMASFAEQSRTTFRGSKGRLSVILSPPETYIDMPAKDILKVVIADAQKLGIELQNNIVQYRKVRLPHDFYSLSTGSEELRPPQNTDITGLTLAGDYTKQPHLATMEGAVVSGQKAAALIMKGK